MTDYNKQGFTGTTILYSDLIGFVATTGSTIIGNQLCYFPIAPGDSGSALIADINGIKKIIGVCFAGNAIYGYACRIDRVKELLKIEEWNGEVLNYSDTPSIMEHTIDGLSDVESITLNGKVYWQVGCREKI